MEDDDKVKSGVIGALKKIEISKKDCTFLRDPMFVGVDPSFNGFAIVVLDQDAVIIEQKLLTTDSEKEVEERIIDLENEFKFIPDIICLHSVFVEGPSYSSNGAFQLQMGALHFFLRVFLYKHKLNYKIISPGTLKKFVADTGNAKKELMLLNVYKKWGVEFKDNNLADAYGLARMALDEYKRDKNNK